MKPYVICHMNTSIDGRTWGSRWRPAENRLAGLFERIHEQLGNGSWLIGRVTGSEYAKADAYPDHPSEVFPREPWFVRRARQDRLGSRRYRRRPDRRDPDEAGLRRASGGAAPRRRLLHLRRRTRARSGAGTGDPEPRAGDRALAARRRRQVERLVS